MRMTANTATGDTGRQHTPALFLTMAVLFALITLASWLNTDTFASWLGS